MPPDRLTVVVWSTVALAFATAYPVRVWLLRRGIEEVM